MVNDRRATGGAVGRPEVAECGHALDRTARGGWVGRGHICRARVPQAQSDNIVASLRERGVPVVYLVAEDEGHGFEIPENRIRPFRAIEQHFAEHLGGRAGDTTRRGRRARVTPAPA